MACTIKSPSQNKIHPKGSNGGVHHPSSKKQIHPKGSTGGVHHQVPPFPVAAPPQCWDAPLESPLFLTLPEAKGWRKCWGDLPMVLPGGGLSKRGGLSLELSLPPQTVAREGVQEAGAALGSCAFPACLCEGTCARLCACREEGRRRAAPSQLQREVEEEEAEAGWLAGWLAGPPWGCPALERCWLHGATLSPGLATCLAQGRALPLCMDGACACRSAGIRALGVGTCAGQGRHCLPTGGIHGK